ncbi:MAG TPA: DHA2 family efflux MFS transporter permease subunit [Solirubrobacteraceae bacterium]|nr:DHA2 family efflux MFS transporter permease subunit [Solirubrobacteraceae bacterium]
MAGPRKPLILVALLLAAFAINLDTTIVNVALPTLVRELHASNSQLQWVVDAYNLVFASFILAAGTLSDRLGRKGMLLAGLAVFGMASAAGGFAADSGQLIAARCVMGLGAAMVFPSTLSLISNVFTERAERARAIGLWGATAGVAIALGPIIGGWLLAHHSWPSIFFAMTPVAAIGALLVALFVPTSRDPSAAPLDGPGVALSTVAISLLVFTIIEAPTAGWLSARSLAGFIGAMALFAAFLSRERRTAAPMIELALFRNPRFTAACAAVTVAFFTLFGFIFLMTQYFQFIKGYSPLSAGVHLLPVAASVGVSSVLGTRLAVRAGTKLVVAAGMAMVALFYLWVATSVTPHLSYGVIAAQMVLYGTGMGLTSAPATEAIMGVVPLAKAGVGSAVNDATRLLGGTLGVAVIGSVYASTYAARLAARLPAHLPAPLTAALSSSVGEALAVAKRLVARGDAGAGLALHGAATQSFIDGLSVGCFVAAGVALAGCAAAAVLLPAHPTARQDEQPQRVDAPAAAAAFADVSAPR